ncbi:MAG: hypothetical protein VX737_03485 [Pseudomonadota bacterium]|nr:hypothetical protein [Pseudomonadota bacterium]
MQSITNSKHTKQKDVWLKQLHQPAQSFINYFCDEDANDQLSDRIVLEKFKSVLGNAYFPSRHAEFEDPTQALFEKSFNQWVFTLHAHAKLTPLQIEKAYRALHYDRKNLSTYSTDELAKLHAVLLEQYPEHYHALLNEYNQILSKEVDSPYPITLDQEASIMQPPTESDIAKLSIFMICKLLGLPDLPPPFLAASILFKKKYANNCDLDIDSAFRFYEDKLVSEEELSRLIDFSKNINDPSHTDKIEIFCESFIASLDITDAFKYSAGTFVCDTKKYQLLMTILLSLPFHSIKRIEFNLSDCLLDGIILPSDELITSENSLTHTENFIQCIGKKKLHWMLISLILCKSKPINSDHNDLSPLLEILHPLLKAASEFDLKFKKSQKSQFIISHHFIINTFDLLNNMCREKKIKKELFIDYCMIGKNNTMALTPIATLSEECERLLKMYRSLCNKISAEQQAILDFDTIQSQPQTGSHPYDCSDDANDSQEVTLSNQPAPMSIANSQESSNQRLVTSSSGFDAQSEVNAPYQLSSQSLPSLSSSTPSTSSSGSAHYSSIDLQISEDERIYLKKRFENLFSIPFDAESRVQHKVTKTYERFRCDYDKRKNANPQSNGFFQPIPIFDSAESPQQELDIFSKLPDCTQKHILSSLHTIHIHQNEIRRCQEEQIDLLKKILTLDKFFRQNSVGTDVDSSIQSASLPFLNAQTEALPKPQLNAKTLKQALILLEISEPYSNIADALMDEDTQDMTADEKKQEDDFQANVMILIKNLGLANTPLLVKLYQNFPRQMRNLSALLHQQYDALITRRALAYSEQKNKRSKHTDKTTKNEELHLENITLCQDLAIALHNYMSKSESLNLSIAMRSFSENPLSKASHPREKQTLNNRSYCFSPDEDNKNFSKTKYPISPSIMSLIKSGAPNITIQYGSPDKRNASIFLPNQYGSPKDPAHEIKDITPSIYLHILFHSQIDYNIRLSEILVYKTLRELEYSNSFNLSIAIRSFSENPLYFSERSNPGPLMHKRISTDHFEIDIHQSGKIIIRTTPQNYKKIDDEASLLMTPIHIKKTKKFSECLRKNFKKSPARVEIIEANLSEDHWEVLFVSSYTLRYNIYHEFCRGIRTVEKVVKFSFPYQLGEIRIIDSKWPGRTHYTYPAISATSTIIGIYALQNSPLESWAFSGLSHTNRPGWNQDRPEIYQSPDIQIAREMKIFSGFNVHQLPKDEDFFARLAPLKFLKNLIFTYQATSYPKSKYSYIFAEEAFKALLKLPSLPALKSVSLTSTKAINLSQYRHDRTYLHKSLDDCDDHIACSKDQIKHARERVKKINKQLRQTQDSATSSLLKDKISGLEAQVKRSSSEIKTQKSFKSEIHILQQGIEFIERKTRECIDYAIPKLRPTSDYEKSSEVRPKPSLVDKPNLKKITLDGDLTFTKKKGLWSPNHPYDF